MKKTQLTGFSWGFHGVLRKQFASAAWKSCGGQELPMVSSPCPPTNFAGQCQKRCLMLLSPRPNRTVNRKRPVVEILEERALLAVRSIVPLEAPVNGATTFHSLQDAFLAGGFAAGDV